jgi:hypothetical protein
MDLASSCWRIENDIPQLRCGPLEGRAEFQGLFSRFCLEKWNGRAIENYFVLGTSFPVGRPAPQALKERYVRGLDLVEVYEKQRPLELAPQLYWRARYHELNSAVQLEAMLSIQTDLLDSDPESSVGTVVMEGEVFHTKDLRSGEFRGLPSDTGEVFFTRAESETHLFVFRNGSIGLSYAEMVHPSDFVRARLSLFKDSPWMLNSDLFHERLEKGVIRRGRVCGWFMPIENDLETAVRLAREFVEEPLPLTA